MYLGVKAVIAKSMERIHKANLVNFAIVPMQFVNAHDYDAIAEGDDLAVPGLLKAVEGGEATVTVQNRTKGTTFQCSLPLTARERKILAAGGEAESHAADRGGRVACPGEGTAKADKETGRGGDKEQRQRRRQRRAEGRGLRAE